MFIVYHIKSFRLRLVGILRFDDSSDPTREIYRLTDRRLAIIPVIFGARKNFEKDGIYLRHIWK